MDIENIWNVWSEGNSRSIRKTHQVRFEGLNQLRHRIMGLSVNSGKNSHILTKCYLIHSIVVKTKGLTGWRRPKSNGWQWQWKQCCWTVSQTFLECNTGNSFEFLIRIIPDNLNCILHDFVQFWAKQFVDKQSRRELVHEKRIIEVLQNLRGRFSSNVGQCSIWLQFSLIVALTMFAMRPQTNLR
jgi:hypothetical protein